MNNEFTIRFWGVRGSIACPGKDTTRYGGNTPCVEVRCGHRLLILDAGTGIRPLGEALAATAQPVEADILFSHCHVDHISGLPFFAPIYASQNRFRLWAGNLLPNYRLQDVVGAMMSHPLFPISPDAFQASVSYRDFEAGQDLDFGDGIRIRTGPLDHPDGATGYRIEYAGRVLTYLTDNEGRNGSLDSRVVALARQSDLVIYDCTFTDNEIASKAGWGHSTWRDGLQLAEAAQAKTFCLFHHAPEHDDECMDRILAEAKAERAGTIAAMEGMLLKL